MSKLRMGKHLPALVLAAALLGGLTGPAFAGGALQKVHANLENKWKPKHAYINNDGKIKWINNTNRFHNIRATDLAKNWNYSTNLPANSTRSRVFHNDGTYIYRCTIHSSISNGACQGMCGFVHVQ